MRQLGPALLPPQHLGQPAMEGRPQHSHEPELDRPLFCLALPGCQHCELTPASKYTCKPPVPPMLQGYAKLIDLRGLLGGMCGPCMEGCCQPALRVVPLSCKRRCCLPGAPGSVGPERGIAKPFCTLQYEAQDVCACFAQALQAAHREGNVLQYLSACTPDTSRCCPRRTSALRSDAT